MERRGEARKWKRTNPRLFFNIHSIIIKTKENSSNWFEIFLSLSLFLSIERKFLSKFTKRRDTWHAISLIRISPEKIPSPAWFEPRSDVKTFNDFLGSDPRWDEKRRGKERKREGERARGGSMFHFPYKFNYDKRRETSRARETHKEKHAQG